MILKIEIVGDGTGAHGLSNYDYTVYINNETIWRGRIEGYSSFYGWWGLVYRLSEVVKEEKGE